MKNLLKFSIILAILSLSLISCKKDTVDQATGNDVRVADLAVSDVFTYTNNETDTKKSDIKTDGMDVNIIFNDSIGSYTTTITFTNFTPADGITRNGEIIIVWQLGWRTDAKKSAEVTFNHFTRDSVELSGTLTITHTDSIAIGTTYHPANRIDETNMVLTFPNGETIKWNGWRTIEWQSGWLTLLDRTDNVFKINWYKTGTNRLNETFEGNGTNLTLDMSCDYQGFTAGTVTITKGDESSILVDFGDGECDGVYTITSGNRTVEVTQ